MKKGISQQLEGAVYSQYFISSSGQDFS